MSRPGIPATIHLVLLLELVKLFQEKTDKDYFYLIVLSFMKVLAASALTIDMSFVITLVLFLVALVSTLDEFRHVSLRQELALNPFPGMAGPLGGMSVWATLWIIVTGVVVGSSRFPASALSTSAGRQTPSLLLSGFTENVQLGQIGKVKLEHRRRDARQVEKRNAGRTAALARHLARLVRRPHLAANRSGSLSGAGPRQPIRDQAGRRCGMQPSSSRCCSEPLATTALFGLHQVRTIVGRLPGVEVDRDEDVYTRLPAPRRTQYEVVSRSAAIALRKAGRSALDIRN